MFFSILYTLLGVFACDMASQKIYKLWGPNSKLIPHSSRWFFIHAFSNMVICLLGYDDLKFCLANTQTCIFEKPTWKTKYSIMIAIITHIYHLLIFFKKLTYQDWLHHIMMVGIAGTLSSLYLTRVTTVGLWFMSGLPGLIDYTLLWLVKMGCVKPLFQKWFYTLIAAFIRSPGCLFACFLTLPIFHKSVLNLKSVVILVNACLTFWNGQYYLLLAAEDYGKKLSTRDKQDDTRNSKNSEDA